MTTREFYVAIAEAQVSDELTTKAQELIAALDAKNEKRKGTETKEKKEAAARRQAVLDFLRDRPGESFVRDQIAEALGITAGQVTAACKSLVTDGTVVKTEAKIDKKPKVVYTFSAEA